jgi:hypothetical protein
MHIQSGQASVGIIERELRHLYRDIRNWNIKQMREEDRYMVTFPSEEMRYQVAKFKSFEFETANVKAKVIPTEMSAEADGKLESVWVRAHRFPLFARKVEVVMEIGYLVGDPEEVDLTTLNKPGPVRIKIACVDVTKVRGESRVFFNGESYNIRWEVEGTQQENSKNNSKFDWQWEEENEDEEEEEGEFGNDKNIGSFTQKEWVETHQ